jgi:hypothetical protein
MGCRGKVHVKSCSEDRTLKSSAQKKPDTDSASYCKVEL